MRGLVLRSKAGKPVVSADEVVWDRTLWQAIFNRTRLGTLTFKNSKLDVERFEDGEVDLVSVLRPVLEDHARLALRIEASKTSLIFKSPGMPSPFDEELDRLSIQIGTESIPTTWSLDFQRSDSETLNLEGSLTRRNPSNNGPPDVLLTLKGKNWPWKFGKVDETQVGGRLDGEVRGEQKLGKWGVELRGGLNSLKLDGKIFPENLQALDRLIVNASLRQVADGWDFSHFDVQSNLVSVSGRGGISSGTWKPVEIEAKVNPEALSKLSGRMLPPSVGGEKSDLNFKGSVIPTEDSISFRFERDLETPKVADRGNATPIDMPISLSGRLDHISRSEWKLPNFEVKSGWGSILASARLLHPDDQKPWHFELEASADPDWVRVNKELCSRIDPKGKVEGRFHPFKLAGNADSNWLKSLSGTAGFSLGEGKVYGLKLGPAEVHLIMDGGLAKIQPIDLKINQGEVHLEPKLELDPKSNHYAVLLGPESFLSNLEVDDEVSRRFLAYAAPVLDRATKVSGTVSADVVEASFPIGSESGEEPIFKGSVEFEDLTFIPGPLGIELLSVSGRDGTKGVRLDKPVSLSIADRKVHSRGLAIPLGEVSEVAIEGWVDFDKNLDLTAIVPLSAAMLSKRPILGTVIDGTKIHIPIRGTLDKPKLDREAFNVALKDLGSTLLSKGLVRGATGILQKLNAPADPDAPPSPPRMTFQERRAERSQKRAERRERRGLQTPRP